MAVYTVDAQKGSLLQTHLTEIDCRVLPVSVDYEIPCPRIINDMMRLSWPALNTLRQAGQMEMRIMDEIPHVAIGVDWTDPVSVENFAAQVGAVEGLIQRNPRAVGAVMPLDRLNGQFTKLILPILVKSPHLIYIFGR